MAEKASAPMWKNGNAGRNEKHQNKNKNKNPHR